MTERRISEPEVEAVLNSYHTNYHDRTGNDIFCWTSFGKAH